MFVYFDDFTSAAEPASRAAAATYNAVSGHATVTSHDNGFPPPQEPQKGRYDQQSCKPLRQCGSLVTGMPAETMVQVSQSFRARCLSDLPEAFV